MGAFAEMPGDVSCICDIIAHELVWTHVSYYNDDAKRTKGIYTQRIQRAWGHTAHRGWARLLLDHTRDLIIHGPAHRGARQRSDERRKQEEAMLNLRPRPFGCARLWMIGVIGAHSAAVRRAAAPWALAYEKEKIPKRPRI